VYVNKTRTEKFSGPIENCQRNIIGLTGSLVTSSRPPGQPQKMSDDRTSNAGAKVRTADGSRRTIDAVDEQCLRCGCSNLWCTVVLCAAYIDGPLHTACTVPAEECPTTESAQSVPVCGQFYYATLPTVIL